MTIKNSIYKGLIAFSTVVLPITASSNTQDNYQVSRSTSVSHEQSPQTLQNKHETARPNVLEYRFKDIPIPQINSPQEDIHELYHILTRINPGVLGREADRQFTDCNSEFNDSIHSNIFGPHENPIGNEVDNILVTMLYKYCSNREEWQTDEMEGLKTLTKEKISDKRLNEILQIRYIDPVRLGLSNEEIVDIQTFAAIDLMTVSGSGITGIPNDRETIEKALRTFVARDDVPDNYFLKRQTPKWVVDKAFEAAAREEYLASQNNHEEESEPEPAFEPEPSRTRSDGELRYSQENIEGNSLLEWIVQEGGSPIEGAIVRMTMETEGGSYEHQGTTNSDGRAIVELSRGDWRAAFLYKDRIRVKIGGRDIKTGNKVIPETHTITPSDLEQADPGETINDEIEVVDFGFMYEGQELGGTMLTLRVEVETTDDN